MTTHPRHRTVGSLTKPSAIAAEIARATAELDRARDEVKRLTEYIGTLRLALTLSGAPLTSIGKHRSVSSVDVNPNGTLKPYTRRAATRATRTHEGLKLLYAADVNQAQLARERGVNLSRVKSWFATGKGNRPIPKAEAEYLKSAYKIPLSVWARIGD